MRAGGQLSARKWSDLITSVGRECDNRDKTKRRFGNKP